MLKSVYCDVSMNCLRHQCGQVRACPDRLREASSFLFTHCEWRPSCGLKHVKQETREKTEYLLGLIPLPLTVSGSPLAVCNMRNKRHAK